ncbi:hypothetical protein KCG48_04900 [Proteiniclasticum sp. BAD-10]|uniref:Phage tail protein n=1 Tax=Proteiniclasticum sediminis TaxID=2804028 RepID=A0A941CQ06_9CLOT|nr:hypothetical protein [Proteiniclasticum sediminis]MBR0575678.1 hypothetical protein [Proteiniclasticum sediminis]
MRRGIIFDNLHTADDWDLILTAQEMEPPKVKTKYIDLPIGDGSIDLTEAIYGDVSLEDREGTFEFDMLCPPAERADLLSAIGSYIHGKKRKIILPDDDQHYYYGRMAISSFKANGIIGKLEIEAVCDPYKYKLDPTIYSGSIGAGGSITLSCSNSRKRVIPKITVSGAVSIAFEGNTYNLSTGTWQTTSIIFKEGQNPITITGAAGTTYSIEYQEGAI